MYENTFTRDIRLQNEETAVGAVAEKKAATNLSATEQLEAELERAEKLDDEAKASSIKSETEKLNLLKEEAFSEMDARYDSMIEQVQNKEVEPDAFVAWENVEDIMPSEEVVSALSEQEHIRLDQWAGKVAELKEAHEAVASEQKGNAAADTILKNRSKLQGKLEKMSPEELHDYEMLRMQE